ncbi:MAG: hypothetical protein Q7J78_04920 [Clostridiales bacterium]|nr:hypothetical protein [Clostridiales bacterium]
MNRKLEGMVEAFKNDKDKYDFFDLNCWWDVSNNKTFHGIDNFDQLKNEIKAHQIKKAVITNAECLKYDPFTGNETTAALIKGSGNLFGAMVLAPEIVCNGGIKKYIDDKIEQSFVAARMFPKKLNHSMKKWLIGDILGYLDYKKLPLILWHNEVGWDLIEELCQEYKNLPVIVEGNDVKLLYHNRNYITLLKKYPNFYLETHNLIIYSEIDHLAGEISDENLIFGTYFPYNTPDASMMPITAASIDEASKHKIAGQNLQRLIDNIKR